MLLKAIPNQCTNHLQENQAINLKRGKLTGFLAGETLLWNNLILNVPSVTKLSFFSGIATIRANTKPKKLLK